MIYLTEAQLQKLTTKRLLAYKNKLMIAVDGNSCSTDNFYKNNPEWQQCYNTLKIILATREHIE